jgi:hypothetical protein
MVFAHGIGGAKDLPIPAGYAMAGAGVALAVSFVVLALAWRTPRFDAARKGRPAPRWLVSVVQSVAFTVALRVLGFVFFGYVVWAAVAGPDLLLNPVFGVVYVLLWVGIVPMSLLFGPFYKALNPLRTIHLAFTRLTGGDPDVGLVTLPRWVGCWPASLGLLAFTWLELVYPRSTYLSPVRLWFAGYLAVVLVGRLSVFGRTGTQGDGRLVLRSPLGNLDGTPTVPGLVGVVAVLFGSTAFDSFKDSNQWLRFSQSVSISSTWLDFLALLLFCLVVGTTFAAATMSTGVHEGLSRRALPNLFAHSVAPIIVGYMVAHYLSYFVEVGQQTVVQLSDPLAKGSNLLGTANWHVSYWISSHPTFLAVVKVLSVVTGHVLGVIAAHDRAIKLLPKRHQLTGQLPLLFVMVFYTVTGLYLLFGA